MQSAFMEIRKFSEVMCFASGMQVHILLENDQNISLLSY